MTIDYNASPEEFERILNNQGQEEPIVEETPVEAIEEQPEEIQAEAVEEESVEEPAPEVESYKVPKERLDAESAKRYAAEEQIKQQHILIEKLMAEINQPKPQQQQQQQEPELNVLDEDAHRYYINEIKQLNQKMEQTIAQQKQQAEQAQLENAIKHSTNEFKAKAPDYQNVLEKYIAFKTEEAQATFGENDHAIDFVDKQLEQLSKNALAQGKNPAEILYNLAKKTVAPTAMKATSKVTPNLSALNTNMGKSRTAGSNNSASTLAAPKIDYTASAQDFEKQVAHLRSREI
jgi:hypothetical protein